jgi:hypothetical protein
MQTNLAGRLAPLSTVGAQSTSVGPQPAPFSVMASSRAVPAADGYVFPVKTATIRVAAGVAHDAVVAALKAEDNVEGVYPNTIMSIVQGERAGGGRSGGWRQGGGCGERHTQQKRAWRSLAARRFLSEQAPIDP